MEQILLRCGKVVKVDKETYHRVINYSWHLNGKGYATAHTKDGKVLLHRLLMGLKKTDKVCVDHINGDPLDNRLQNLRIATVSQNLANMRKKAPATSKYKGVSKRKGRNLYQAYVNYQKKRFNLGYYQSEEQAALAYNKKAFELYGEFASLNEVGK